MVLVITYRSAETITNTRAHEYRWRELPQVRFLSRQTFGRDKHIFVATNMCLSRQKTCLSRQDFVVTRIVLVAAPANDIGRVNRNKSDSSTGEVPNGQRDIYSRRKRTFICRLLIIQLAAAFSA